MSSQRMPKVCIYVHMHPHKCSCYRSGYTHAPTRMLQIRIHACTYMHAIDQDTHAPTRMLHNRIHACTYVCTCMLLFWIHACILLYSEMSMVSKTSARSFALACKLLHLEELELQRALVSRVMATAKGGMVGTIIK